MSGPKKLSYISPVFIIRLRFLESYLIFRHVYGYSVGVDLTRRDLQNEVSESGIMEKGENIGQVGRFLQCFKTK